MKCQFTAWKVSKYGVVSGPYFPVFELNTEVDSVKLRIQSENRKIQTRNNSVFGHFSRSNLQSNKNYKNTNDELLNQMTSDINSNAKQMPGILLFRCGNLQCAMKLLTLSWRRHLSYSNQSIHLLCKSMDWFLYDGDLLLERTDRSFLKSSRP